MNDIKRALVWFRERVQYEVLLPIKYSAYTTGYILMEIYCTGVLQYHLIIHNTSMASVQLEGARMICVKSILRMLFFEINCKDEQEYSTVSCIICEGANSEVKTCGGIVFTTTTILLLY